MPKQFPFSVPLCLCGESQPVKVTLDIVEQPDGTVAIDIKGTGVCSPREVPVLAHILIALTAAIKTIPKTKLSEHEIRDISIPLTNPKNG